jgi:hypothetical protein
MILSFFFVELLDMVALQSLISCSVQYHQLCRQTLLLTAPSTNFAKVEKLLSFQSFCGGNLFLVDNKSSTGEFLLFQ